jgi:hypothetical protein
MHLTPEQFIDIIDGARADASMPHLAECRACRDQLAAMRASMGVVLDADVPEPPPFFWERLSANVRDRITVDEHGSPGRRWSAWLLRRPPVVVAFPALAAIAILFAVLTTRLNVWRTGPAPATARHAVVASTAPAPQADATGDLVDLDDPLLMLVADLSANMDPDAAADAGFSEPGSAEHAVIHMSGDELRALRQLLQQEMARPGA